MEVLRLRMQGLDVERRPITVRSGKGEKEGLSLIWRRGGESWLCPTLWLATRRCGVRSPSRFRRCGQTEKTHPPEPGAVEMRSSNQLGTGLAVAATIASFGTAATAQTFKMTTSVAPGVATPDRPRLLSAH